ncbi:PTS sugar transporter subunit IIA [Oceanobacillus neutriphilus]|uniref:PTS EIIA type-4 domain-containing protein n=1 Tax=Oceanobacillus neutriphilus TaxID=531815 RepID=A0ABQ2NQ63_9BACI|nr:hypothetical protein [Oceanobacillus neutriphilus]GGP07775.1 hypothetical protein GCM10011346_05100 [Oceanobacillus neutriphilus]
MRQIILAGHGDGCLGMKQSTEMILGEQTHLYAVSLSSSESAQDYHKRLHSLIDKSRKNGNDELWILTDIKGGTPGNVATLIGKKEKNITVISGYHLAMIITACTDSHITANNLIEETNKMIKKII